MKQMVTILFAAMALTLSAGEKLFELQKTPEALKGYDRYGQKVTEIVKIENENKIHFKKDGVLYLGLDPAKFAGKKLEITMIFKTSGIPETPKGASPSAYGFKAMLCGTTPDKKYWGQQIGPFRGSCDWRLVTRKITTPIPEGLGMFRIELSSPAGEVWIDELTIKEIQK